MAPPQEHLLTPEDYTVFAVVVTYNGSPWIEDCLQSLEESHHPVRVVVVDNGSTDSTAQLVSRFSEVTLLRKETNLGFGQGNNIGIAVALSQKADAVFLLNQDARIEPDTIHELVRCASENPRFGILSPMHLNKIGTDFDAGFAHYLIGTEGRLLFDLFSGQRQRLYATEFVNAAAWLVTAKCLNTIGGFDPLFFMYGEDNDYCNRARWHGFEIGLVPTSIIFHARTGTPALQDAALQRLRILAERRLAHMLVILNRPEGSFFRRLLVWIWASLRMGLILLEKGDLMGLLGWLLACLRAIARTPTVWQHRRRNRCEGRHWI